jgi:3-dehydrosphinganine reductase
VRDFRGKSVVVTGGSSGIGLATAKLFAARGGDVAIVARDPERLENARGEVESARREPGQRVLALTADVTDRDAVVAAMERVSREFGTPDVLVNSAGIFLPGHFETMPEEWFRDHLEIDVLGLIHTTRAVVPGMIERGSGHVVNVSSVAGFIGCVYGYTAYSTAKFAVMGFSEALRSEMKPLGIRVSVVCPPDVDTPGLAKEKSLRPPETDKVCGNMAAIKPEAVAAEIVRAVETGKYYVIPGALGKVYFRLKGLLPGLFFAITDGDVAKARKQRLSEAPEAAVERE